MNILALDTCFGACSVAVGTGIGGAAPKSAGRFETMATGQAERLMPMVAEVMTEAGLAFGDLDRIAVTVGPGSFTGTRICLAAARAFSLAHTLPVVAFSSLEVIANSPRLGPFDGFVDLLVAMTANRGEVYAQRFDGVTREARTEPGLLTIEAAADLGGMKIVAIAGTAAREVEMACANAGREPGTYPVTLPDIRDIIPLAARRQPLTSPPTPLYLRPPDAKPQDGKSLTRAP